MLQVPPTGAPTARFPSRAPQSDPADPAFAGVMALAAQPGPQPASPANPPAEKAAAAAEVEGHQTAERAEPVAVDPPASERTEHPEAKPAAEKEAAPSGPSEGSAEPSPTVALPQEPLPAPLLPASAASSPLGSAVPAIPVPAAPASGAEAPPQNALQARLIPEGAELKGAPAAQETPKAPVAPPPSPSQPPPVAAAAAVRPGTAPASPPPLQAPDIAQAEVRVEFPNQVLEKFVPSAPSPAAPALVPGETAVQAGPARVSLAGKPTIPTKPLAAEAAPEASPHVTAARGSDEGPQIQEPGPGAGSQKNLGDLARGLKGQISLAPEAAPAPRPETGFQLPIPKPGLDAPAPSPLLKSQAPSPAEAPRKEPPAPAPEPTGPRNPPAVAVSAREPGIALPRSESLGLQPAQGGAASAFALSKDVPASTSKAPVQLQWQAPVPSLVNQVEGGIRWMLRASTQGAELQLHPENLGRVRIELRVEGAEVHARLWASDPKSLPLLQDNKAFLEVSLKEQGLNLGSFDLRQNPQQTQTGQQGSDPSGHYWATEAPPPVFRQETPIPALTTAAQARRLEIFV